MSQILGVSAEMPRYRSHKMVHAMQIARVNDASENILSKIQLEFVEDRYAPVGIERTMVVRYMPVPGDYLVVYDDGYQSISPKKAFEEGYTKIGREQASPRIAKALAATSGRLRPPDGYVTDSEVMILIEELSKQGLKIVDV